MALGRHKHKCGACGTVWEHPDIMAGDVDAHRCPKCGAEMWAKYKGGECVTPLPKVPFAGDKYTFYVE